MLGEPTWVFGNFGTGTLFQRFGGLVENGRMYIMVVSTEKDKMLPVCHGGDV